MDVVSNAQEGAGANRAVNANEAKEITNTSLCYPHSYRELQREKAWSRIHLVPLLLAESDRDVYRRDYAALEREKEIMKDVPGWEVRFLLYLTRALPASCRSAMTCMEGIEAELTVIEYELIGW